MVDQTSVDPDDLENVEPEQVKDSDRNDLAAAGSTIQNLQMSSRGIPTFSPGCEKHRWVHGAAVKAVAFAPGRKVSLPPAVVPMTSAFIFSTLARGPPWPRYPLQRKSRL